VAKPFINLHKNYAGNRIQGDRSHQEDHFCFDNSRASDFLMVIADGMGGHQGGAIASHCAVNTFIKTYRTLQGSISKRLWEALQKTNDQLALEIQAQEKLKGMGCTLVGVALNEKGLEWISVGDSPLWLYHAEQLHRLNADHSMMPILQKQVQRGVLTPNEALEHPNRHLLRSALMGSKIDLIDQSLMPLKLFPGDRILLASDGILTLSEQEICQFLSQSLPAHKLVNKLLGALEKKGKLGQDNATVLVVNIPDKKDCLKKTTTGKRGFANVLLRLVRVVSK
jgi:serine/threonine protein phosphatase PrpC